MEGSDNYYLEKKVENGKLYYSYKDSHDYKAYLASMWESQLLKEKAEWTIYLENSDNPVYAKEALAEIEKLLPLRSQLAFEKALRASPSWLMMTKYVDIHLKDKCYNVENLAFEYAVLGKAVAYGLQRELTITTHEKIPLFVEGIVFQIQRDEYESRCFTALCRYMQYI